MGLWLAKVIVKWDQQPINKSTEDFNSHKNVATFEEEYQTTLSDEYFLKYIEVDLGMQTSSKERAS